MSYTGNPPKGAGIRKRRKSAKIPPSMGEGLGELFKRTGMNRRMQEQKILNCWEKAVGEGVAEKTQPVSVKDRVLQVKVVNSVWMQELQFMKELIMQKLQQQTGNNILRDLRFFMGEIEPSGGKDRNRKKEGSRMDGQSLVLSEAERERIDRALSGITDPEMREILGRIYAKGLAAWKYRSRR
jgi:predicted nucleic acid-binding Zn ribbon protein